MSHLATQTTVIVLASLAAVLVAAPSARADAVAYWRFDEPPLHRVLGVLGALGTLAVTSARRRRRP